MDRLEADGVPTELAEDESIRQYLAWRAEIAVADRMADLGSAALTRMRRDPVLSEAVRLLGESSNQAQLFAAAQRRDAGTRGSSQR